MSHIVFARSPRLSLRPAVLLLAATCLTVPVVGYAAPKSSSELDEVRATLAAQQSEMERQKRIIAQQQVQIDRLIEASALASNVTLGLARGAGPAPDRPAVLPDRPVGEAPAEASAIKRARVEALPESQGVLTPAGSFVFDPQIQLVNASNNRLVFRGIELIPGLQLGAIEASTVDSDTIVTTAAVRYGISSRLEAEIRIPYLFRRNKIEVVQQRDQAIVRSLKNKERQIGDVELGLRYQFNEPHGQRPIWIGELHVKSDTGKGPFDIDYDEFGVARGLTTGSGFWSVQPGMSFLLPSDPVVIYGGASYIWHIARNINKMVGGAMVGRVDPGDAIGANIGFGFAINPRFSFSLGYKNSYIIPTKTTIGGTKQKSDHLQVGSLSMGLAYRITEKRTVSLGFNYGVTRDAPNVEVSIRMPFQF